MKRVIACLLIFVSVLLGGCAGDKPEIRKPAAFYYRRAEVRYGTADGVVAPEIRESDGFQDNLTALLNRYIQGPQSPELVNVFPKGSWVLSVSVSEELVLVHLNHAFSQLSGMNLTIACACMTKTVTDLTGVQTVRISAEVGNLGGAQYITVYGDEIVFEDESAAQSGTVGN